MNDIRKFAVVPTTRLHLRDANDELMYLDKLDAEGKPLVDNDGNAVSDLEKPIAVNLYGPGSKQYARAKAEQTNRAIDKLKRKGKTNESAEEQRNDLAEFLAKCTASWENMSYDRLEAQALSMAVYSDLEIGFIPEQVNKYLGEWGNFSKASTKTSLVTSDAAHG